MCQLCVIVLTRHIGEETGATPQRGLLQLGATVAKHSDGGWLAFLPLAHARLPPLPDLVTSAEEEHSAVFAGAAHETTPARTRATLSNVGVAV